MTVLKKILQPTGCKTIINYLVRSSREWQVCKYQELNFIYVFSTMVYDCFEGKSLSHKIHGKFLYLLWHLSWAHHLIPALLNPCILHNIVIKHISIITCSKDSLTFFVQFLPHCGFSLGKLFQVFHNSIKKVLIKIVVTTARAPELEYTFIYLNNWQDELLWFARGFLNSLHFHVVFVGSVYPLQIKADIYMNLYPINPSYFADLVCIHTFHRSIFPSFCRLQKLTCVLLPAFLLVMPQAMPSESHSFIRFVNFTSSQSVEYFIFIKFWD